jgi:hypothetical protein
LLSRLASRVVDAGRSRIRVHTPVFDQRLGEYYGAVGHCCARRGRFLATGWIGRPGILVPPAPVSRRIGPKMVHSRTGTLTLLAPGPCAPDATVQVAELPRTILVKEGR